MAAYVHPAAGVLVLGLLLYVASLGIRSRGRARNRGRLLATHARVAPLALALVALSWVGGIASTVALRDDLALADSSHFKTGTALLAVMLANYWTSRRALAGSDDARELHVWLGVAATLLATAQAFTGLRITP